ncbi:cell division protein FtsA [Candidatus Parcubacteria bacterium]|nr:MAG: cell division protein FtsA [Candidatus Parcubacteria bacterium]
MARYNSRMTRRVHTGIDIGSSYIKVVIATPAENSELPMQILGTGTAPSKGVRHGYVTDIKEAAKSIREALGRARAAAKVPVRSARLALGGMSLEDIRSTGDITLTPSGGIVTDREVERAVSESEKRATPRLVNRTVLHTIPLEYRVDGQKVFGKPHGLQGTKLSVDTLFIAVLAKHYDDAIEAVEAAGVEVEGVMASPLAASFVTLSKAQKTAGVILVNIGGETLSTIVFDNDVPVSVKVFSVGGADVTNAIALSFRIPLTEAEQMKRGAVTGSSIPPQKMNTAVATRLKDMFLLVNIHLKAIGRHRLLPAGVILTGGGSSLTPAIEVVRTTMKLPAQVAQIGYLPRSSGVDSTWAVAYGLCRWGFMEDTADSRYSLGQVVRRAGEFVKRAMRSLLP